MTDVTAPPNGIATPTTPGPARRPLWLDLTLIAAVVVVLVGLGVVISRPWWDETPWLRRDAGWLTLRDGQASQQLIRDAAGAPLRWTSTNVYDVPIRQVLAGRAGQPASNALEAAYPGALDAGDIPGAEVYELRTRVRDAAGPISDESVYLVQDDDGTRLFAFNRPGDRVNLAFTPPFPVYPPMPQTGDRWQTTGVRSDGLAYTVTGEVLARGVYSASLGSLDDCIRMDVRTVFSSTAATAADITAATTSAVSWECPTIGSVTWDYFDAAGSLVEKGEMLASSVVPGGAAETQTPPLGEAPALTATPPVEPDGWQFSRVGRVWPLYRTSSGSATFAPVYVPADSPFLLAAVLGGELTALDPATGATRWRFNPGGTVYSPPAVDLAHGRIYFGSSGKTFYALDLDGFFLWSFPTRDNIPTHPLLVDGLVVFGSEDRSLYALDAATGTLRWRFDTGSPIASSPAAYPRAGRASLVVFGADDGGVYAVDAADGALIWQVAAEDAVEAPVVVAGDLVYAAARDGFVYALDAATGAQRWAADLGTVLRLAPAVGRDHVYVVDQFGDLHAIDRRRGVAVWALRDVEYGAAPLVVDLPGAEERVLAPRYAAGADWLDPAGRRLYTWDAATARLAVDAQQPSYLYTPVLGGEAFWFADDGGVIHRLGPPLTTGSGVIAALAWRLDGGMFPFASEILYTSPVAVDDDLLIFDMAGTLYRIDAGAGKATVVGKPAIDQRLHGVEPVAAGDTLLASFDDLVALDAGTARVRWRATGNAQHLYPPAVSGETVLWLSTETAEGVAGPGVLVALGLDDGATRWRVALDAQPFYGGVAANDDTVVTASPPAAYDLATSAVRWRGATGLVGLGVPAIAGDLAYIGTYDLERAVGSVRGLDLASGAERWRTDFPGDDALNLLGRIWAGGERVIVPTYGGAIYAFGAADGATLWEQRFADPPVGGITVMDDRVYVLLDNGDLVLLDAATGAELARARSEQGNLRELVLAQRPIVHGDRVVAAIGLSILGFQVTEAAP